jgi:transposase
VRVADAERIARAGGEPAVELVLGLLAEITALRERVDEHERLLKEDSRNSSRAPSNDPPLTRQQRRARERERAKQQGRKKRGGQPGHEGKSRELAAPERVDDHVEHVPVRCGCGHRFDGSEERAGDPVLRQKWELPEVVPLVIEHRLHRLLCPECGSAVLAGGDGISGSSFGPRLEAQIAVLAGVYRLSRRQIVELLGEMFATTISVGAVDNSIMRISRVLADPWRELRDAVRKAQAVHADETSWRLRGDSSWLWVAASTLMACYRIDPTRSQAAAKELLGEDFGSFVITDRYAGYHWLDVLQHQLCWCHAIRQFVGVSERPGAAGRLGHQLLKAAREVIRCHREYLQDGHDLDWLHAQLAPIREQIQTLLEQGARGRHPKTQRFCAGLLDEYDAMWTFCDVPGISPTNNAAERALRHGVLLRKIQLGAQSQKGNRWIERICSTRETCRLQGRSVLGYLQDAATAAQHRQPIPSLTPT